MVKIIFSLIFCCLVTNGFTQTFYSGNNQVAITIDANDNFSFAGKTIPHYGLGWYNEQINVPPSAYISGFSGIRFFTWGQPRFLLDGNGNIGIGTSNPESRLHLQDGSIFIKTVRSGSNCEYPLISGTQATNGISGHAGIYLYEDGSGGFGQASGLAFKTSVNDANPETTLLIKGDGNVGIGTITPREKLSVNGNIRAREIKVESTNWPDYVFEEGYKVETLKGLESYIKTNKHLPDMPTAKEVETNGIAVSEMLKLQQKKIEELTLHLIEKDKQLNNQSVKVTDLEIKLVHQDKLLNEILKKLK